MTQTRRKPLVPITREFLKQFYQKYPMDPIPGDENDVHMRRIDELAGAVTKPGSKVPEQVGMETPKRIDDCFWRNRMVCEEIAFSLSKLAAAIPGQTDAVAACERCSGLLLSAERSIVAVQELNTSSVKDQLKQFIPQDFRGAILERQRVATEARFKKQIDDLVQRGGTIRQKYDMYLQQQWERRQALVQLGECSGMYKVVIKWVAGIPQVLLDFAKEINAKLGPLEEQRIKYGPDLYCITTLGIRLDVCMAGWVENVGAAAASSPEAVSRLCEVVEPAVQFYCEQMLRVVRFIGDVFQHSPFFLDKDDLDGGGGVGDEVKQEQAQGLGRGPQHLEADCRSSASSAVVGKGAAEEYGAAHSAAVSVTSGSAATMPAPVQVEGAARPERQASVPSPSPPATPSVVPTLPACPSSKDPAAYASNEPRAQPPPQASAAAASVPPRPPPLVHVDTPSPRRLTPGGLPGKAATAHAGHHGHHGHAGQSGGTAARTSLTGESVASFFSAVDHHPWMHVEEQAEEGEEEDGKEQQRKQPQPQPPQPPQPQPSSHVQQEQQEQPPGRSTQKSQREDEKTEQEDLLEVRRSGRRSLMGCFACGHVGNRSRQPPK